MAPAATTSILGVIAVRYKSSGKISTERIKSALITTNSVARSQFIGRQTFNNTNINESPSVIMLRVDVCPCVKPNKGSKILMDETSSTALSAPGIAETKMSPRKLPLKRSRFG